MNAQVDWLWPGNKALQRDADAELVTPVVLRVAGPGRLQHVSVPAMGHRKLCSGSASVAELAFSVCHRKPAQHMPEPFMRSAFPKMLSWGCQELLPDSVSSYQDDGWSQDKPSGKGDPREAQGDIGRPWSWMRTGQLQRGWDPCGSQSHSQAARPTSWEAGDHGPAPVSMPLDPCIRDMA